MTRRLLFTFVFLLAGANAARAERYSLTDLGTLGGAHSEAYGINDLGQVVGTASTAKDGQHAFLWSGGKMTDLGTLGGRYSIAYGINNVGQVVGHAYSTDDRYFHRPFLYSGGKMTDLGNPPGAVGGYARAINDEGQVVGDSFVFDQGRRAFRYRDGKMSLLGDFGGLSTATAINAAGQIAGYADVPGTKAPQAFLYSHGKMTPLGSLGTGIVSYGYGVNNLGQVVGSAYTARQDGQKLAFLYSGGKMLALGTLPGGRSSEAYAITDGGLIVGTADMGKWPPHAFLYKDGKMFDLNSLIPPESHLTLMEARGVNSKGQIVGIARTDDGALRGFVLTPTDVPEPGSLALLGVGAAGLAGYAWRRRGSRKTAPTV